MGASFLTTRVQDPETDTTIRLQIWDTAGQERFRSISKLYYRGAQAAVLCYDITSKRSFEEMGVWLRELKDKTGGNSASDNGEEIILHIVGTKSDVVALDPSKREVPFERCINYVAEELYPETLPPSTQATRPSSAAALRANTHSPPPNANTSGGHGQITFMSPHSNRSSGFWGQEHVWDCCHEISAKDGEGIEEVFRVITRKLVEQHQSRLERQRRAEASMGRTPGFEYGHGGGGGHGHGAGGGGAGGGGYFDLLPSSGGNGTTGSFRLGHGDKRRSWLGFPTTPGALSRGSEDVDAEELSAFANRRGKCC